MMRNGLRYSLVTLLILLPISCRRHSDNNDWLIVPGQRVGPITHDTSEEELKTLFGTGSITNVDIHLGEGAFVSGTAIFAESPEQRLAIIWTDEKSRKQISEIRIEGDNSKWHTAEGVTLGTSLTEIERLNGKPFELAGFNWDRAGAICGMKQGHLTDFQYDPNNPDARTVRAQLLPPLDPGNRETLTSQVQGDRIFSSDHPVMQQINPRIGSLEISLR